MIPLAADTEVQILETINQHIVPAAFQDSGITNH